MQYRVDEYLKKMRAEAKFHKEKLPTRKELRDIISTVSINEHKYTKPNLRNLYEFTKGGI